MICGHKNREIVILDNWRCHFGVIGYLSGNRGERKLALSFEKILFFNSNSWQYHKNYVDKSDMMKCYLEKINASNKVK